MFMYNSVEELEAIEVGSVLGIFRKDNSKEPYQVAVKNAMGLWALAGIKTWISSNRLFENILGDDLVVHPMWLVS